MVAHNDETKDSLSDLNALTHEKFQACVKQPFHLEPEEGDALELELIEVATRGSVDATAHPRAPFSVIFRGPKEPVLPQQIYVLRNTVMGILEIFLVPIGPDQQGMCYEAVFA